MDTSVPHRFPGQGMVMAFMTVHSHTASETDYEKFPEEEVIWVETFISLITLVPSGALLTTAELDKTDVLHVLH